MWGYGILGKGPNVDSSPYPTLLPPPLFGRNEFNREAKVKDIVPGLTHFMAITGESSLRTRGVFSCNACALTCARPRCVTYPDTREV